MTDRQKNSKQQFHNYCETIDFAGMMEAMMSQKEELCGCGCMERMKKMASKSSRPQKQDEKTTD
jgi:hypothetical protein